MRFLSPILIALSLTAVLGGCSSTGSSPAASSSSATADGEEESGEEKARSAGGARVCGWSDTGRWVCTGGAPKKSGGTTSEKPAPAKPAAKKPAKKPASSGLGNAPKESEIVTEPVDE